MPKELLIVLRESSILLFNINSFDSLLGLSVSGGVTFCTWLCSFLLLLNHTKHCGSS